MIIISIIPIIIAAILVGCMLYLYIFRHFEVSPLRTNNKIIGFEVYWYTPNTTPKRGRKKMHIEWKRNKR